MKYHNIVCNINGWPTRKNENWTADAPEEWREKITQTAGRLTPVLEACVMPVMLLLLWFKARSVEALASNVLISEFRHLHSSFYFIFTFFRFQFTRLSILSPNKTNASFIVLFSPATPNCSRSTIFWNPWLVLFFKGLRYDTYCGQ